MYAEHVDVTHINKHGPELFTFDILHLSEPVPVPNSAVIQHCEIMNYLTMLVMPNSWWIHVYCVVSPH